VRRTGLEGRFAGEGGEEVEAGGGGEAKAGQRCGGGRRGRGAGRKKVGVARLAGPINKLK
jgi:hypothetical protein